VRQPSWLGSTRIELASCGSTNDEAGRLARAGAKHGTVVIARAQTAGRGRMGRAWSSPENTGLYASAIVRTNLALVDVPPITLAIGIGVCDAARAHGAPANLKWPNDVLVAGKKLAGVLVESFGSGGKPDAVIVGIGVNLAAGQLDPELRDRATSLVGEDVAPEDLETLRASFTEALLAHVEHWIDRYVAGGLSEIVPAWEARMAPDLLIRTSSITGQVAGLARDGALVLRDELGELHEVRSGDIEVTYRQQASS